MREWYRRHSYFVFASHLSFLQVWWWCMLCEFHGWKCSFTSSPNYVFCSLPSLFDRTWLLWGFTRIKENFMCYVRSVDRELRCTSIVWQLPYFALFRRIHFRPFRTTKIVSKFFLIRKWSDDTKTTRWMETSRNSQFQRFWTIFWTPNVGCANPKHLLRSVIESGQSGLGTVFFSPR